MTTPRVTLLMPFLNAMPYLPAAVESIQAQTVRDFTFLAIDDGSTDGSLEYLRSLQDSRIRVIADGSHRGLGGALNHGLAHAFTEFVARMDADDLCSPDRLALQLEYLDQHQEVGALGTQFTYFGGAGKTGFARRLPLVHKAIYRDLMAGVLAVIHASLMMRTELLRGIGGYRLAGAGEDWDMFLRLGEVTKFANLTQVCYYYRLHDSNVSTSQLCTNFHRVLFACRCAAARQGHMLEPTEDDYRRDLNGRPILYRCQQYLHQVGLARYFAGRNYVLNSRPIRGYWNLMLGAGVAPWRVASRLRSAFVRSGCHPASNYDR